MNSGSKVLKIAAMPGDGIGKEVMPEGLRVLDAASRRFGFELKVDHINWGSCDHYMRTGAMMPPDWKEQLQGHDAIYFGAVGWPATVPDHVSLWGSLLKLRREFDQYINLRPVRLFDGVPCPLAGRKAGDIDFFVVRENTEGEYTNLGGRIFEGTDREVVIQESVFSRHGTDRVMKYAFELAKSRARKKLTVATNRRCSSRCTVGTGHLRQQHRQPDRHDLVRCADARFPWLPGRPRCHRVGNRNRAGTGPRTRDLGGTASTTEIGEAIASLV